MEEQLAKEPHVAQELAALQRLLSDHPIVQEFQEIQARALQNQGLLELEEALKQAQKEIVQFEHYEKPEAKKSCRAALCVIDKRIRAASFSGCLSPSVTASR